MSSRCFVDPSLAEPLRQARLDSVEGAFAYTGGADLSKANLGTRRRTQLTLTDDAGRPRLLFLKRYGPEPLLRRLRRWLATGWHWSEAGAEFHAIGAVRSAGVPTMQTVAFEQESFRQGRSFILVSAVPGEALERCGAAFFQKHAQTPAVLESFTLKLADLVRKLHAAGLVHRDLYASHVFLHEHDGGADLYLIDLARVFAPRWRPFRWRVKDLAALRFSMETQWVDRCWDAFLRHYLGSDDASLLAKWNRAVGAKADWMRCRADRREKRRQLTPNLQGSRPTPRGSDNEGLS